MLLGLFINSIPEARKCIFSESFSDADFESNHFRDLNVGPSEME
jgi:hypothetical protein